MQRRPTTLDCRRLQLAIQLICKYIKYKKAQIDVLCNLRNLLDKLADDITDAISVGNIAAPDFCNGLKKSAKFIQLEASKVCPDMLIDGIDVAYQIQFEGDAESGGLFDVVTNSDLANVVAHTFTLPTNALLNFGAGINVPLTTGETVSSAATTVDTFVDNIAGYKSGCYSCIDVQAFNKFQLNVATAVDLSIYLWNPIEQTYDEYELPQVSTNTQLLAAINDLPDIEQVLTAQFAPGGSTDGVRVTVCGGYNVIIHNRSITAFVTYELVNFDNTLSGRTADLASETYNLFIGGLMVGTNRPFNGNNLQGSPAVTTIATTDFENAEETTRLLCSYCPAETKIRSITLGCTADSIFMITAPQLPISALVSLIKGPEVSTLPYCEANKLACCIENVVGLIDIFIGKAETDIEELCYLDSSLSNYLKLCADCTSRCCPKKGCCCECSEKKPTCSSRAGCPDGLTCNNGNGNGKQY